VNPPRASRPAGAEIDRLELSAADQRLIQRMAELYVPEPRPAPALRPAAARHPVPAAGSLWTSLVPGLALAACLVLLLSGLPALREGRSSASGARAARTAAERAASADWEEHLLFSDVVSQRVGSGTLPPEYRAIESLFFEG
jgi:hypothetical protein